MTPQVNEEFRALGDPVPVGAEEVTHSLWNMVTAFSEMFRASIRGAVPAVASAAQGLTHRWL